MTGGSTNGQWALATCFGVLGFVGALIAAGITKSGHTIDMAVMHFLLFYGGVFALIGLTAAVGLGLLAADRIVMTPGRRIIAQAVHRAVSFGAVGFLVIHIVSETVAGRSRPVDAVVPFLGQTRTLYLGMGTLASDLLLLILVTGIARRRFATVRPTWVWRALHATAYLAWPLGILHGLLDGRTAKPYVDWSYGACVAAVGLALIVRLVVASRVQETASSPVPAAPPWLSAGGASPWLPGGAVTQLEPAPVRPAPALAQRPPLALPAPPARGGPAPPRGMPTPPRGMSSPPRGMPTPPRGMPTLPRGMSSLPRGMPSPPPGMPTPPRGMSSPPRGMSSPPRGMSSPPRGVPASPPGVSTPPRGMPPATRATFPPSPPRGIPGHIAGDRGYADPGGPGNRYYDGPYDEDDDPGWADADDPHAEYGDPGQYAGYDDPDWADDDEYGPGPGPPYLHADTPDGGWAR